VWDGDAILMAQMLSTRLGLGVGISSGANVLGAMRLVEELVADLGEGATVATVLPDSNKKYLTTDLCRAEPVKDGYWAPRVTLDSFNAIR
jgi:cysteine synthase A